MSSGSVTAMLADLRAGKEDAAERLWEKYFSRVLAQADRTLGSRPRRSADEEDVALSVFKSVCVGAREGRFPKLMDRQGLWPLLVAVTANKCADLARHENRKKRGGSGAAGVDRRGRQVELEELFASEPPPDLAAAAADELNILLDRLDATGDASLRTIALEKLADQSNDDIATKLGCARRTVERKLQLIARLWGGADVAA